MSDVSIEKKYDIVHVPIFVWCMDGYECKNKHQNDIHVLKENAIHVQKLLTILGVIMFYKIGAWTYVNI